jgi:hypothetical protein
MVGAGDGGEVEGAEVCLVRESKAEAISLLSYTVRGGKQEGGMY